MGLKVFSEPDGCLQSCGVTAGGTIFGNGKIFFDLIHLLPVKVTFEQCGDDGFSALSFHRLSGVWLCFICCPLQGGSNLQPTHEPVYPKPLNLNPKKLFCLDLRLGRPLALSVGQLQDERVYKPWIPSVLEV